MSVEEIQQLQTEIALLKKENERLKTFSVLPTERQEIIPSELNVDPLIGKLRDQLVQLQDANLIFGRVMEVNEHVSKALSTLVPAMEVQILGMQNETLQLRDNLQDTESTYVSVIEKLENQIRQLKEVQQQQQKDFESFKIQSQKEKKALHAEIELLRNKQNHLQKKEISNDKPESQNPFTSLNIFDL